MTSSPIVVAGVTFHARPMTAQDRNAVFATWMRSARQSLEETRHVAFDVFQRSYPGFVERLLDGARTVVLFRQDSPAVVHAWACAGGPDVLHWAYVPFRLRGEGIGRAVITAALGGYPDRIDLTTPRQRRDAGRWIFNPFVAGAWA